MRFLSAGLALIFAGAAFGADESTMALLSLLNSKASGSPKVYRESLAVVKADAEKGKALQQFVYATVCPNDAKAGEYLEASRPKIKLLAEKKNNALAWYLLSLEGQDMDALKKAVEGGNVQALNAWGTLMHTSAMTMPNVDEKRLEEVNKAVFDVFRQAAAKNDPNGLYNLGMCYMNGIGCERDVKLGFNAFKTAAERGHPEAINNVGGCYREGIVVERDLEKAARWFKISSDFENAYGRLNYGLALQNGDGVEQDEKAAFALFQLAADDGSAEAINLLAVCYMNGIGTGKDEARAVELFKDSARLGFPPAMENLCECYSAGRGVKADAMESMVWKLRARAAMGDKASVKWLEDNGHKVSAP